MFIYGEKLVQSPGGAPASHDTGEVGHVLSSTLRKTDRSGEGRVEAEPSTGLRSPDVRILRPDHGLLQLQQSDVVDHLTGSIGQPVLIHEVTHPHVPLGLHLQSVVSVIVNVHHPWEVLRDPSQKSDSPRRTVISSNSTPSIARQ